MSGKLFINGTILDERPTGLGVYVKNVVSKLKEKDENFTVFCPINIEGVDVVKTTEKLKTSYKKKGGLVRFLWTQFVLPFKVGKNDIVYHPFQYLSLFSRAKQIITIHDFIPLYYPEVAKHQYYYYKFIMPILLKKAYKVICISENTKNDVLKFYNIYSDKLVKIYNGYDRELFNVNNVREDILEKYNITRPYFIAVGAGYSHKNLETALNAFSEIVNKFDSEFVIVGKDSNYILKLKELVKKLHIEKQVKFIGYVPDEDLPTLYNKSKAFVYPTLYEGFGLPILEAMACETVVLTANNSSLPEVYGDAALDFDAKDEKEIVNKMKLVLTDSKLREKLIELSKKQIAKFTWDNTAEGVVKIVEKFKV